MRSSPSRMKRSSSRTLTSTEESPGLAPRSPRRPRLGAIATAVLAAHDGVKRDLHRRPAGGLQQAHLDGRGCVLALCWAGAGAEGAAAEEGLKQVRDRREAVEVGGIPARGQALM